MRHSTCVIVYFTDQRFCMLPASHIHCVAVIHKVLCIYVRWYNETCLIQVWTHHEVIELQILAFVPNLMSSCPSCKFVVNNLNWNLSCTKYAECIPHTYAVCTDFWGIVWDRTYIISGSCHVIYQLRFVRHMLQWFLYSFIIYLKGPVPAPNDVPQNQGPSYGTILLPDLVHRVQVTGSARG